MPRKKEKKQKKPQTLAATLADQGQTVEGPVSGQLWQPESKEPDGTDGTTTQGA